jgi:hypothetical protein
MLFAELYGHQMQAGQLAASKSASNQHGEDRVALLPRSESRFARARSRLPCSPVSQFPTRTIPSIQFPAGIDAPSPPAHASAICETRRVTREKIQADHKVLILRVDN